MRCGRRPVPGGEVPHHDELLRLPASLPAGAAGVSEVPGLTGYRRWWARRFCRVRREGIPADRAEALEQENRELWETLASQMEELEAPTRQVAELEHLTQIPGGADAVDGDQGQAGEWRPPRRRPGIPDAGVVTLVEQPDEELAFGPAAQLVAEWRKLRTGGDQVVSRVDRDLAAVGVGGGTAGEPAPHPAAEAESAR